MKSLFLSVVNMSITGSYVILFILLARLLLKKAPKKYSYALWAAAAFRLCCPVTFRARFSLFSLKPFEMSAAQPPSGGLTYLPPDIGAQPVPQIATGIPAANAVINPVIMDGTLHRATMAELQTAGTLLWLAGILALLLWAGYSALRLHRSLGTATRLEEGIWQSEQVRSPFILGLRHPKIYIPYGLDDTTLQYVLEHERYHLRHRDHLVRAFGYGLLTLHWFNPLCWLAFHLMSRDMELRCDEAVLAGDTDRADYSTVLLSFAANRRMPLPSPLAFGETGVRQRIKNALRWRKPPRWALIAAALACVLILAVCAADPRTGLLEGEQIDYALCGDRRVADADLQTLLALINQAHYSRHSTGQVYNSDTDTLVALYDADGSVWTLHYWYCSGFSWDPRHLGEDDYYTVLSKLDPDGNPVKAWKLEYDFDKLFLYWKNAALEGVTEPVKLLADLDAGIEQALLANADSPRHDLTAVAWEELGRETHRAGDSTRITVYLWAVDLSWSYTLEEGEDAGGSSYPAVVTFLQDPLGNYQQIGFKMPRDGSYYDKDIRAMFPADTLPRLWKLSGDSRELHDLCWQKLSAAKPAALAEKITLLFDRVASGPLHSSNPGSYISAHPDEWTELLHYSEATFEWCCTRFLQGGQYGLEGHLYWAAVNQLIDGEAIKSVTGTGQDNFDAWYSYVQSLDDKNGREFLQKYHPWGYRLLQIAEQ